jgi:DNA-binding transcriptional MerR regulator
MKNAETTYSIGQVANKVGLPKYKLRHWCDNYLPHIQRIQIGETQSQRRFTEEDIELIRKVKDYREKGFMLDRAMEQAKEYLNN